MECITTLGHRPRARTRAVRDRFVRNNSLSREVVIDVDDDDDDGDDSLSTEKENRCLVDDVNLIECG